MKKLLIIPLSFMIILTFSGCNIPAVVNGLIDMHHEKEDLKRQTEEIVECFNSDDVDTLEAMFCQEARTYNDLPTEIQNAFDCLDGKIVSYEYLNYGLVGGTDEGKYDKKEYTILLTATTEKKKIMIFVLHVFLLMTMSQK